MVVIFEVCSWKVRDGIMPRMCSVNRARKNCSQRCRSYGYNPNRIAKFPRRAFTCVLSTKRWHERVPCRLLAIRPTSSSRLKLPRRNRRSTGSSEVSPWSALSTIKFINRYCISVLFDVCVCDKGYNKTDHFLERIPSANLNKTLNRLVGIDANEYGKMRPSSFEQHYLR